jgi:hypothetical protein
MPEEEQTKLIVASSPLHTKRAQPAKVSAGDIRELRGNPGAH